MFVATALSNLLGLAPAEGRECLERVGRWPYGPATAVAVAEPYVYYDSGAALMVADVSIPSAPRVVGEVFLPGTVEDMVVAGSHVYVANRDAGLSVIDVGNPEHPLLVSHLDGFGYVSSVAVAGDFAYVADYGYPGGGLHVVDVSMPAQPVDLGFVAISRIPWSLVVSGDLAYASTVYGLTILDVSDPAEPVEIGSVDATRAKKLAVSDGYAYIACESQGVRVVDVSDPSNPFEVARFWEIESYSKSIVVQGNYAIVVDGIGSSGTHSGLRVLDISDPANPVHRHYYPTTGFAEDVVLGRSHVYVADRQSGLRLISTSTPSDLVEIGSIDTPDDSDRVALFGNYALLSDYYDGMRVVDIGNREKPVEVAVFPTQLPPTGPIVVSDNQAFVVTLDGLQVVDVSSPSFPEEIAFWNTYSQEYVLYNIVLVVDVSGRYVIATGAELDSEGDLFVIDASTPTAPMQIGQLALPDFSHELVVSDGYAYVAPTYDSLRVIDVSSRWNPVEVASFESPDADPSLCITKSNDHLFICTGSGLQVVGVSDPENPIDAGYIPTPGYAAFASVADNLLFVINSVGREHWIRAIDVSNLEDPVELSARMLTSFSNHLSLNSGFVYAAEDYSGFEIFDVSACSTDQPPGPPSLPAVVEIE